MKAKEFLDKIREYETRITIAEQELQRFQQRKSSHSASDVPVHVAFTSKQEHDYWMNAAEESMLIDDIDELKVEEARYRMRAYNIIKQLTSAEYEKVIYYRYFNGWGWNKICKEMSYSRSWMFDLHAKAIEEIEILLEEN